MCKTNYTPFETNDEIIKLKDLLYRWKGALHFEIINEYIEGQLPAYHLVMQRGGKNCLFNYKLQYSDEGFPNSYYIKDNQPRCVFLQKDIDKIEKDKPQYLQSRTDIDEFGRYIESDIEYCFANTMNELRVAHTKEIEALKEGHAREKTELEAKLKEPELRGKNKTSWIKFVKFLLEELHYYYADPESVKRLKTAIGKSPNAIDRHTVEKILKQIQEFDENNSGK